MHGFVLGAVAAGLTWALPARAQLPPTTDSIDRFVSGILTPRLGRDIGSGTVVVVQGTRVVYLRSFGFARTARKIPAVPDSTIYQVGSNSKLFVATAAMQLVEQGKLDLSADINRYLHDLKVDGDGAPVTMAQLLTHTSGIQDRKLGRTQALSDLPLMTLGAFFNKFPPRRVVPGGVEINYSGNAISLGAHVIEEISGERFDEYAERHIFQPLGVLSASFRQPLQPELLARRAAMPAVPPLIEYPEGGLAMTVADMGQFLIVQLNGGAPILRPETIALMHAHHYPPDSTVPGVAYGFFEARMNGYRALVHTGDYQHQSVLCVVPDAQLAFFLVVSPLDELREPLLTTFVADFFKTFLPREVSGAAAPIAHVSPTDAHRYVGIYRDEAIPKSSVERFYVGLLFGEGDARVTYDPAAGTLSFQPPGSPPLRLVPVSAARFRAVDDKFGLEIVFRDSTGRSRGLYASAGPLGAYSFARISWVVTQDVQLILLLAMLAVFGAWCVYVAARFVGSFTRRGRARAPLSAPERLALYSATAPAMCSATGFIVWCVVAQFTPPISMITGVPLFFYILPVTFTTACIAAPWAVYGAVRAWRAQALGIPVRILQTAVTVAALVMIPFCAYWCLLGVRT